MDRIVTPRRFTRHAARGAAALRGVLGIVVAVLLVSPRSAAADAVDVSVDRTQIAPGETVTLSIVLEGKFDDTTGPEMPDFEVVGRDRKSGV